MNSSPLLALVGGVLVIPALVLLWLTLGERLLRLLPPRAQERTRPWIWLAIPLVLGGTILVYPLVQTVLMSFQDRSGTGFVGLANYDWVLSEQVRPVLVNNLIWLIVLPLVTLGLGLVIAALADRVRYEWLIRTVMILPIAISFSAAAIIWRLMYAYQPAGASQTGTLNGILNQLGLEPVAFLSDPAITTWALIVVGIWMSTGTAMLMLSAAIKNVDASTLEAARLDGAGELRAFWHVAVPQITPTIIVVYTTQVIFSLKIFDIVYTMTNGAFGTNVIANRMYAELFQARNYGHASAIAVVLLIVAIPIIVVNVRQFREENAR
ncbi:MULTISPECIES: sugar ABC transporter permease [Actinoplanes]|uniref:carbohydrate ABC transporter permease n=1 Tax=Actinoplanes TaxID=1865 RepID=UPI0005F2AE33|nr:MULTISPECIES: sugar ABC transporter permease [Actinoplanes]GLY08133.1 alpha-glucoside ABC transporter permease [Actinoplanes sp. NBRC 101535]